ncbi:hypothetical protein [Chitinophaga sp.]|uniref:hypothetical protein n=1 Tax=Chitinophaga sp. TaxID=1869181 RepID=UPI0031D2A15F
MKKTLLLSLLAVMSLCAACKKHKQTDPCIGLYARIAPAQVGIVVLDKETGENILLAKNIDPAKVTVAPTERVYFVTTATSNLYGSLVFHIADTSKGAFSYNVNIPEVATFTLKYTNDEKETGNVCNPTAIVVNNPTVGEYPYTTTKEGTVFIITIKI